MSSSDRFELNDTLHDESPCGLQVSVIATSATEAIGSSSSTGVSLSSKEADSKTGRAPNELRTTLLNFSGPFREVTRRGRADETWLVALLEKEHFNVNEAIFALTLV